MTLIEILLLLQGTGIAGLGIGIFKWAWDIDRRVLVIETRHTEGKKNHGNQKTQAG